MSPIDPFEQDVRAMLRRRAGDIAGDVDHPGMPELSVAQASHQRWRSALLVGATAAVTLLIGLAVVLPRIGDVDSQIVIAGPSAGTVGSHSAPYEFEPDPVIGDRLAWDLSVPSAHQMPAGVDLASTPVLFVGDDIGSNSLLEAAQGIVSGYFEDRLDASAGDDSWDSPAPGPEISFGDVEINEYFAVYRWDRVLGSATELGGWIYLRRDFDSWGVVAVTADGVDMSGLKRSEQSLIGEVTSEDRAYGFFIEFHGGTSKSDTQPYNASLTTLSADRELETASGLAVVLDVPFAMPYALPRAFVHEGATMLAVSEVAIPVSSTLLVETDDQVAGVWDLDIPSAHLMPAGTDLATAPVLFLREGSASFVVGAYLSSRLGVTVGFVGDEPPFPGPEITFSVEQSGELLDVYWWIGPNASGYVYLRRVADGWGVVAATTDGVDFSGLAPDEDGFSGEVSVTNGNDYYLFVVGDPNAPCVISDANLACGQGTPHQKVSGAEIRVGVGGMSSHAGVLRLYEVEDSTLLSITEIAIPGIDYLAVDDQLLALNPNRMVFKGDGNGVLVWEAGVWAESDLGENVDFPWPLDGGSWIQAGNVFVSLIPGVDNCSVPDGVHVYGHLFLDGELNRLALITGTSNNDQIYECATEGEPTGDRTVEPLHGGWANVISRPNGTFTVKSELEGSAKIYFADRNITGDDPVVDYSISTNGATVAYLVLNGVAPQYSNKVVARNTAGDLLGSWEFGSDQFVFGLWALEDVILVRLASYDFVAGQDRTPPDTYVSIDIASGKVSALSSVTGLVWIG